jgi:hypothetical protein
MAMPSNTFATYEAVGNREDLSDEIFRIDPTDTPFFTMCEKVKASAVNHEWQTQALDNRDTGNAVLEGDDATTDATVPTVRLGNICQISDKVARVSGTQQAVEHAGRGDELGYQKMLKGLALKLDIDAILCGTNQGKMVGDDSTARKTASVLSWLKTNTSKGTGTAADPAAANGAGARTDGTQVAFTEDRAAVLLDQRRQAECHHVRRLQQAAVLDLHRSLHADGGCAFEKDRGVGRRLRVRLRRAEGGAQPPGSPA